MRNESWLILVYLVPPSSFIPRSLVLSKSDRLLDGADLAYRPSSPVLDLALMDGKTIHSNGRMLIGNNLADKDLRRWRPA
jgi:hypothetical protein